MKTMMFDGSFWFHFQNIIPPEGKDYKWYINTSIYTWNPNDPCFGWKRPCFEGFGFKNRGHLGSRYIYI